MYVYMCVCMYIYNYIFIETLFFAHNNYLTIIKRLMYINYGRYFNNFISDIHIHVDKFAFTYFVFIDSFV